MTGVCVTIAALSCELIGEISGAAASRGALPDTHSI